MQCVSLMFAESVWLVRRCFAVSSTVSIVRCACRAQTPQELDTKPPLLADVALSVTDLVLNLFKRMFSGPETGNAEEQMMNVMEASVLKRYGTPCVLLPNVVQAVCTQHF